MWWKSPPIRDVAMHRTLGTFGISIATGLVIFAAIISIENVRASLALGADPFLFELMYLNLVAIVTFLILFVLAMSKTRQPEYHRRLILLATIGFIGAGINRFYVFAFGVDFAPFWFLYAVSDLFILALVINDWRTLRRLHPATITGGLVIVVIQLLHWPVAGSPAFESITYWLVSLGGYQLALPG